MTVRTHVVVAVAAFAAGSLALAAPSIAKARFDAHNAHQVDGYHASQLNVVKYWNADKPIDNFDGCHWQPVLSRSFTAPAKGTVVVSGVLTQETDFDFAFSSQVFTRITIDGKGASVASEITTEPEGQADSGNSPVVGGRQVGQGRHVIVLQAEECSDHGEAYLTGRSMIAQFSTSGSAQKPALSPSAPSRQGSL
jgi:hypothetical protein